ncbi:hypothetical protein [Halomonas sp. C05BenzN]|uniref:hypothetical protein n=1 Tax=Halomonas sp. C05BenzN TaxID=3411041 RepID=UPI003B92AEB8
MTISTRPAALLGGLLTSVVLTTASAAMAATAPDGYRSAAFGMSAEEVGARLEGDGVVRVSQERSAEGDLVIDGQLQAEDEPATDLRYVFPGGEDRLALVVAFHPEVDDRDEVMQRLAASHGEPWPDEMAEWWYEQLKDGMPETPHSLEVWGGDDGQRSRFVRLWTFDDYLSVEYLDTRLFPAGP